MDEKLNTPEKKKESFWDLVRFALVALLVVVPIRLFVAEPFIVSGPSMLPTFQNGNYLIVDKLSYKIKDPSRYDVVVFRYPGDTSKFFIKRIIGLPGETIDINGSKVVITNAAYPDGFEVPEPFVKYTANNDTHYVLQKDEYFVLGDNRGASSDSRYWGAVKRNLLTGRPFLQLLPLNKISVWPGSYNVKI